MLIELYDFQCDVKHREVDSDSGRYMLGLSIGERAADGMDRVDFYIIVPVYNVEKNIRDCIQSVLDQTYTRWRMLLVDDGSRDQSGEICDEYASKFDNISVVHQENRGLFAARQVGIRYMLDECQGNEQNIYMVSLDSDDTLKQYALKEISNCIREYDCDMVVYNYDRIENGVVREAYDERPHFSGVVRDKRMLYQMTCMVRTYSSVCTKAVSLSIVVGERRYTDVGVAWGEDTVQSLDYWRNSCNVYFLDKPLYNYRINSEGIMARGMDTFYKDALIVDEVIFDFLESEKVLSEEGWKEYKKWCSVHLTDIIIQICASKRNVMSIRESLEWIRQSGYYRKRIEGGEWCVVEGKRKWIGYLLERKQYRILILLIKLYVRKNNKNVKK